MADQLAAGFLGCYGSGVDSSPTLDRLAGKGMRFDRCYAHVPVCAPNRATIFTGRSSDIHGVVVNNLVLTNDNPTFPQVLQHQGYRTGGFGKFHLTPMPQPLPEDFNYLGFNESIPSEDPKLGPWLDWIEREHPEHYETALAVSWEMPYCNEYGKDKKDIRQAMAEARDKHLKPRSDVSDWAMMYPSPLPKELHQTTYITDISLDFMRRHLEDHSDKPFMTFVSYVDPHDPYDPPTPYDTMFDPDDMPDPLPSAKPDNTCQKLENSRDFNGFREIAYDTKAIRKLRALYHGSIRFIDDQVSRIVSFLEENNQLDNTIIVFTTDHGDMMGDQGLITKGVKHYDKGIRCPLIVSGAGIRQGVTDRLTSSLDFFPAVCDWAGMDCTLPLEGKSFVKSCSADGADDGWDVVTVQAPPTIDEKTIYTIITADGWRFSIYDEDKQGEMFNLRDDPDEQHNLYNDPAWIAKRLELTELHIRAYMQCSYTQQYRNLPVKDGGRCIVSPAGWELEASC